MSFEQQTTFVTCAALEREVRHLVAQNWPAAEVRNLKSALHLAPVRLQSELDAILEQELQRGRRVVLVYGECSLAVSRYDADPHVSRTQGCNCYSLLLGRQRYLEQLRRGSLFLLPEWMGRWQGKIGVAQARQADAPRMSVRRLLYLDTHLWTLEIDKVKAYADFCGLPLEVIDVGLDGLWESLREAMGKLSTEPPSP